MYACDARWWKTYAGVPDFSGEKWSTHHKGVSNNKAEAQELWGVNLVRGKRDQYAGFSFDSDVINYGDNSGFQAINLALLLGSTYIVLIGFDMSAKQGTHFFGDYKNGLTNNDEYERWIPEFDAAANNLPPYTKIINATPGTALHSFPEMTLERAIENYRLHCHRT